MSVVVPLDVPCSLTVAPITGSPVASTIRPLTLPSCAEETVPVCAFFYNNLFTLNFITKSTLSLQNLFYNFFYTCIFY